MQTSPVRGVVKKGMPETCKNPWNGKCTNSNIELYIYYKNKTLPICSRCWSQIADKDIEW